VAVSADGTRQELSLHGGGNVSFYNETGRGIYPTGAGRVGMPRDVPGLPRCTLRKLTNRVARARWRELMCLIRCRSMPNFGRCGYQS
jgi:hypothetical protein